MKKKICGIWIIILSLLIILCSGFPFRNDEKRQIKEKILKENLSANAPIGNAITQNLNISIMDIEDDFLVVEVDAPNIADELFRWVDSMEEQTLVNEQIESEIVFLLDETLKEKIHLGYIMKMIKRWKLYIRTNLEMQCLVD